MMVRKRILSLMMIVSLLFVALPLGVSAENSFPTVLAETKKGVVAIYGLGDNGYVWSSWTGTGFAVGEQGEDSNIFLTNRHVVSNDIYDESEIRIWILQKDCAINVQTGEPDPNQSITCEVLKTTSGYPDYAIIRATESVSGYKALPLMSSEEIPDGTTVYALGYPGVVDSASASHYGIDDITATNGMISKHMQYAQADNTWVLMHTAQISGGNSGGPLITEDGAVIGLNTYGFGESEKNMNRYCAVYVDYAIEGLDELGIQYDLFGEGPPEPTDPTGPGKDHDDGKWQEFIPTALAVVVIIAVSLLLVLKKNKKQEVARHQQLEESCRQAEKERRREEQKRTEAEICRQEEQQRIEQTIKAKLQLNGGAVYPICVSGVTIGREKVCTIVLPENAPGVSRTHCKLEFRGEQLVLTDLGSTYGTYIHGKRVPANTPIAMRSGSSFSLGSEKITFTVC